MRGLPLASSIFAADAEPWEVRWNSHKFFLPALPLPPGPRGYRWEAGPGRGKLAGETGRGAARCGAKASAKVTRTSGGHELFVLGPKEGAKAWRVPPARRAWGNRQILVRKCGYIQFRLSEGLNLGVRGNLGQPRVVHAVPEVMPTPAQESDWQNGEACKWVDLDQAVRSCTGSLKIWAIRHTLSL